MAKIINKKDISKCFGLLKAHEEELKIVMQEAKKSCRSKWRKVD